MHPRSLLTYLLSCSEVEGEGYKELTQDGSKIPTCIEENSLGPVLVANVPQVQSRFDERIEDGIVPRNRH